MRRKNPRRVQKNRSADGDKRADARGGGNALPFRGLRSSSVQIIDASEPFEKTRLCPL